MKINKQSTRKSTPWRRLFLMTQSALLLLFLYSIVLLFFVLRGHEPASAEALQKADVAVIFGAAVWGDHPSPRLTDRLNAGFFALKGLDCPIVVSGGQGDDERISEALAMKRYLVSMGISEDRIYLEDKATSTRENISYSQALFSKLGLSTNPTVILVTSDYHMLRVNLLAKLKDWTTLIVPAHHTPQEKLELVPRELLALTKDLLLITVKLY